MGHEGGQWSAGNARLRHEGRQGSEDVLRLEGTAESIWRRIPSFLSREDSPGGGIQHQACCLLRTLLHASARSSLPPPSGGGKRLLVLPFFLSALQRGFSKRLQPSLSNVLPGSGVKIRPIHGKATVSPCVSLPRVICLGRVGWDGPPWEMGGRGQKGAAVPREGGTLKLSFPARRSNNRQSAGRRSGRL